MAHLALRRVRLACGVATMFRDQRDDVARITKPADEWHSFFIGARRRPRPCRLRAVMPAQRSLWLFAVPLGACASSGLPPVTVDVEPTRQAVADARAAGAAETAAEPLERAEAHLAEAEALLALGEGDAARHAQQAKTLLSVAEVEAAWAADAARRETAVASATTRLLETEARLTKLEAKLRRLEDRASLLQSDLERTETELIRAKTRLMGAESKADASSAIAEAHILIRRLADGPGRGAAIGRCRKDVARAEQLMAAGNFGAAVFFAMRAQETATRTRGSTRTTKPD